jgi:phage shock protein PspC (stress-responsive transcriptional regulator)
MNEITRIHIAKVAYDIEVTAKKQLEKYIKSLESYTQDSEVLADIEIRITELLAERNVLANGVIGSDDIEAIRKQLGEPYEFADDDGDIAVGALRDNSEAHRLYRNVDTALFGGVLGGISTYYRINPLWARLAFIVLVFMSFGTALLLYAVLWVIIPAARTAAQKLQLAGKPVTLESIRELNIVSETNQPPVVAPLIRRILGVAAGVASLFAAIVTICLVIWSAVMYLVFGNEDLANQFTNVFGAGSDNTWLVWLVYYIVMFGLVMLSVLFSIIAYALLAKKLTKRMIITSIVIVILGLTSAAVAIGITATQSWRVSSEAQAAVQTTKQNLPNGLVGVKSVVFENPTNAVESGLFPTTTSVQYIVDAGMPRYELTALPKAKVTVTVEGDVARVSLSIPNDYRNGFVQPYLIVYGPAIEAITTNGATLTYDNANPQDSLLASLNKQYGNVTVNGTFNAVSVKGNGTADVSSSAIQALTVDSQQELNVTAGTVKDLSVTQPEVCATNSYGYAKRVTVSAVTSGTMTYNGQVKPAMSYESNCASVQIGDGDTE